MRTRNRMKRPFFAVAKTLRNSVERQAFTTTTTTAAAAAAAPTAALPPAIQAIHDRARALPIRRTIVLAEGDDERVSAAAVVAVNEGLANVLLLCEKSLQLQLPSPSITALSEHPHARVLRPCDHPRFEELTERYCLRRGQKKDPTILDALSSPSYQQDKLDATSSLYFANLLVNDPEEIVDGSVAGAVNSSGSTVSSAIKVLGLQRGVSTLSSFFIMSFPPSSSLVEGSSNTFIYSDCAVVVSPTSEQLADIAIHAAHNAARFLPPPAVPRVALLSFSTHGSSAAPEANVVRKALQLIRSRTNDNGINAHDDNGFIYDGELQLDAAILPHVTMSKAPLSPLCGGPPANVLIFPNLAAGNIGYKMSERMGGAVAVGPILQGLASPANDLSRGCTTADILDVIAVTALQVE